MSADEMIVVIQAHKEGKTIQAKTRDADCSIVDTWRDCTPNWDFYRAEFRVKPEPREWWLSDFNFVGYGNASAAIVIGGGKKPIHVREVIE